MKWLLLVSVCGSLCLGYFVGLQHRQATIQSPPSAQAMTPGTQAILTETVSDDIENTATQDAPLNTQSPTLSFSQLFITLLESHQYTDAINLYRTIKQTSEQNSFEMKEIFLSHIEQLMLQFSSNQVYIRQALDTYLYEFYNDIDTLMLFSKYHIYSEHYFEGVNTLQLIDSYAYSRTDRQKIDYFYPQFIQLVEESFANNQRWGELIHLYQHIENTGMLTLENQYRLTELLLITEENEQALSYSEALLEDNIWKSKTTELLESFLPNRFNNTNTDSQKVADTRIPLVKYNNQFIINITLSLQTEIPLLIDTGASITTLSKEFYDSISSRLIQTYKGEAKFSTANGHTNGNIYTIDTLKIGKHTLQNIDIAVIDFPSGEKSSGLLGMNILSQFHFTIDQEDNSLTLTPR